MSFKARLEQTGARLVGSVEESIMRGSAAGRLITATISGAVSDSTVWFMKFYDAEIRGYDAVRYEGVITDEGLEVSGTWTISPTWSGSFIMIRARGLPLAAVSKEVVRL